RTAPPVRRARRRNCTSTRLMASSPTIAPAQHERMRSSRDTSATGGRERHQHLHDARLQLLPLAVDLDFAERGMDDEWTGPHFAGSGKVYARTGFVIRVAVPAHDLRRACPAPPLPAPGALSCR